MACGRPPPPIVQWDLFLQVDQCLPQGTMWSEGSAGLQRGRDPTDALRRMSWDDNSGFGSTWVVSNRVKSI